MFRRSTNETVGYTHHGGDFTAHVDSSHGVRLSGGSTGGIVEAVGDDTAVSLTLRGQGSAGIFITPGTTSATAPAASTTPLRTIQRYFVQYTVPALSSGPTGADDTVTVTGLTTNSILLLQNRIRTNDTAGISILARCSTVNELALQFFNNSASSITGSTQSGYLLQFAF